LVTEQGPVRAVKQAVSEAATKTLLYPWMDARARPIWDAEWDVALVLDACRVDLMAEVLDEYSWLPDTMHSEVSVGSASPEWIGNTFAPKYAPAWRQTGYVTGNAFSGKQPGTNRPPSVYPLRDLGLGYLDEAWTEAWDTEGIESVTPETLTERGLWAYQHREELGIERVAVHYMQPHIPFRSKPEWSDGWDGADTFGTETNPSKKSEWHKLRDGEIDREELWWAYKDNLRYVLEEVQRWVEVTDATILITSDHANGMGEWGTWGHPVGVGVPAVRRVPWLTVQGNDLREYEPQLQHEPGLTSGETTDAELAARLSALGYR